MKIAIDIGNTSITCGVFEKNKLTVKNHFDSEESFELYLNNFNHTNINKIIISSVVPKLTEKYVNLLSSNYINHITIIDNKNSQLVLKIKKPESVGADRLCNIKATLELYQYPAIIVDFGTATTYDVINNNGEFIGGAIASGVETSATYLIQKAALLSKTDLKFPQNVIGIDTKENIQSGIMYGALCQVEGMIKRISHESDKEYNIILTGGFSVILSPYLSLEHTLDPDLTLNGMICIDKDN